MLLCLSSGATQRYRQDILRAIAQPAGAVMQFRYSLDLIAESLKQLIGEKKLKDERLCLAYLDRGGKEQAPRVVPCRAATLLAAEVFGEFCVLSFRLDDYLVARNIDEFAKDLAAATGNLPQWSGDKLIGKFCERLTRDLTSLVTSDQVSDWQTICKTLAAHEDFKSEPFFYRVEAFRDVDRNQPVPLEGGKYTVVAGSQLELRFLHYAPALDRGNVGTDTSVSSLLTEADEAALSFVTSKRLVIDSGYDVKSIRMRAAAVTQAIDSMITVNRKPHPVAGATDAEPVWDFDLPIHVEPRVGRTLWQGALIGAGIACQGLTVIWTNVQITEKFMPSAVAVVAGLITGLIASFGLRKP
jgi:hypothetical protein